MQNYIKLKGLCLSEEKNQQNEKSIYRMEEMFANNVTYKGLIPNIYKQLTRLNTKKKKKKS